MLMGQQYLRRLRKLLQTFGLEVVEDNTSGPGMQPTIREKRLQIPSQQRVRVRDCFPLQTKTLLDSLRRRI